MNSRSHCCIILRILENRLSPVQIHVCGDIRHARVVRRSIQGYLHKRQRLVINIIIILLVGRICEFLRAANTYDDDVYGSINENTAVSHHPLSDKLAGWPGLSVCSSTLILTLAAHSLAPIVTDWLAGWLAECLRQCAIDTRPLNFLALYSSSTAAQVQCQENNANQRSE